MIKRDHTLFVQKTCLWLFLLFPAFTCAQTGNNWFFGRKAALQFTTGAPQPLATSMMITTEACASISDDNGNLLFYSNGVQVFDRNHQLMPNGGAIGGNVSTCQMSIVPVPGNPDQYYVFTADAFEDDFINGYRYSTIDMSLNGGNGAVTSFNNLLWQSSTERMTAVRHANGIYVWLITNDSASNVFRSWLIDCNGLQSTAVVSTAGVVVNQHSLSNVGVLKASPDGKYVCQTSFPGPGSGNSNFIQLFDFDNATGMFSNPKQISVPGARYNHAEFSPDSKLLYLTSKEDKLLDQLEITLPSVAAIQASRVSFPTQTPLYDIQLAVDEKIYIAQSNTRLGVIRFPNRKGAACGFQENAIDISPASAGLGLPSHLNDILGNPDNGFNYTIADPCSGEVQFNASSNLPPLLSWEWDFGDGQTSSLQNPLHTYADPTMVYKVKLTVTSVTACGKVTRTRQVMPSGMTRQTVSFSYTHVCDSGYYRFTNESSGIGLPGVSYFWDFGDGSSAADLHPIHPYAISGPVSVKLKMLTGVPCFDDSVTRDIDIQQLVINTIPSQSILFGESVSLTTVGPPADYKWDPPLWLNSTTVQSPVAAPLRSTLYTVRATDANNCIATDTVRITVTVPDNFNDIYVPTGFTPNNDGRNDVIRPLLPKTYELLEFSVYNRWGQRVFTTRQRGEGWNGRLADMPQDTGVYIWVVRARDNISQAIHERKGSFAILR